MRRTQKFLGTILAFGLLSAGTAWAADDGLKPVLQARYADMKAAMATRSSNAVAALLTPDFVSVDTSGNTESGAQMTSEVAALPIDPNRVSQTTILSVRAGDGTATVDQRYDMKTTKTGSDGVLKHVELVTLSTDTWTKSNGSWLMRRTVTRQIDYFVNGQNVMHKIGNTSP